MPNTTPAEEAILVAVKQHLADKNHKGKVEDLTKFENKVLDELAKKFELTAGDTSPSAISSLIQQGLTEEAKNSGVDDAATKTRSTVGRLGGLGGGLGGLISKGAGAVRDINQGTQESRRNKLLKLVDPAEIEQIATDVYTAEKEKAAAAKPGATTGAATLESVIKGADVNGDGVLTPTELTNALKASPLTKGQQVTVDNQMRHDYDTLTVGANGKPINLSDLGITINDGASPATGFPTGKTVVQKGR